jgi:hypothetical protein
VASPEDGRWPHEKELFGLVDLKIVTSAKEGGSGHYLHSHLGFGFLLSFSKM